MQPKEKSLHLKNKRILIATIVFFVLVNTSQLWEAKIGIFAMVILPLLLIYFLVLSIILLGQLVKAFSEKFQESKRRIVIAIMSFVLITSFIFPNGLINYEVFGSKIVLITQREGAANCLTTLKLKANYTFIETSTCFGVTETNGNYSVSGDTIFFENTADDRHESSFYAFAIIKKESEVNPSLAQFVRYKSKSDTVGVPLLITKNELNK